jgi:AcrR family transcriptional regulator
VAYQNGVRSGNEGSTQMNQAFTNKTQQRIFESGHALFQRHGIRRVSVTEICSSAQTSKVTFYKYFDNKQELAKAIIARSFAEAQGTFQQIMEADTSFYQKVQELMLLKLAAMETFSNVFAEDLFNGDFPEIQQYIETERHSQKETLHRFFESGIKSNEIRQDLSVEMLSFLLDQIQTMVFDERFSNIEPNLNNRVMQAMEYFFYGIKNHD